MYGPYVRDRLPSGRDNGVLYSQYIYQGQTIDLPRGWWLVPAVVVLSGFAGWLFTLPMG